MDFNSIYTLRPSLSGKKLALSVFAGIYGIHFYSGIKAMCALTMSSLILHMPRNTLRKELLKLEHVANTFSKNLSWLSLKLILGNSHFICNSVTWY